jgi:uncharacterized membrane protein YsdA (DUF1294 family)
VVSRHDIPRRAYRRQSHRVGVRRSRHHGGTAKCGAAQNELIPIALLRFILVAVAAANLAAFALYGADKQRARRCGRRIPERTLLLAALAGPFGALAGMRLFRHKTHKPPFVVAVPLFAALHAALIASLAAGVLG